MRTHRQGHVVPPTSAPKVSRIAILSKVLPKDPTAFFYSQPHQMNLFECLYIEADKTTNHMDGKGR